MTALVGLGLQLDRLCQPLIAVERAQGRFAGANLDARGILGDEPDDEPRSSNLGRILIITAVILLGIAAVVWWFSR